jgi:hypothetical protein
MQRYFWLLVFVLGITPAFGQDLNDDSSAGAQVAFGNLAIREAVRSADPLEELKAFLADQKLPLSRDQQRQLKAVFESREQAMQAIPIRLQNESAPADAIRKLNLDYLNRVNGVLTNDQQVAWRHYRVEQIRLRGGHDALASILNEAGTPLSASQDKSIQQIFENFALRRARLVESNPDAPISETDKLAVAELDRVVALLSAEQRQALQAFRRRGPAAFAKR